MSYAHELLLRERLKRRLSHTPALASHPVAKQLIAIVTGETNLSTSGYPYISGDSFQLFRDEVLPHLADAGA